MSVCRAWNGHFWLNIILLKLQYTCVLSRHSQKFKLDRLQGNQKLNGTPELKTVFFLHKLYFQVIKKKNFELSYFLNGYRF